MTNKDPMSLMRDALDGINNLIKNAENTISEKQGEIAGWKAMVADYEQAIEAFKMFDIKVKLGGYAGLEKLHKDKGINKDTLPFDPDENINRKNNESK